MVWRLKEGRSSRQDWGCGRQGPAGADSGDNDSHQIGYLHTGYAHVRGCLRADMAVFGLEGPKPPFPFYICKLPLFLHFVSLMSSPCLKACGRFSLSLGPGPIPSVDGGPGLEPLSGSHPPPKPSPDGHWTIFWLLHGQVFLPALFPLLGHSSWCLHLTS